jgi:hypothetical protein
MLAASFYESTTIADRLETTHTVWLQLACLGSHGWPLGHLAAPPLDSECSFIRRLQFFASVAHWEPGFLPTGESK